MMLELERRREEFEQRMEQDRRNFEFRLEELAKEERKRSDRIMRWLTIALIVFAIAQVIEVVLVAIPPDSWVWNLFR